MTEEIRFGFGANWSRYLEVLDETKLTGAKDALSELVGRELHGARFVDVGSGSGIHSLAAWSLGAEVTSFDDDLESVACTARLRDSVGAKRWSVERGSALDAIFMARLGSFDVVYSWGVLHHTGAMWDAISKTATLVAPGGTLVIAIYNYQPGASERWERVKRRYTVSGPLVRRALLSASFVRLWGRMIAFDAVHHRDPMRRWREYAERGMDPMVDLIDWVGGYPYEAATPEVVEKYVSDLGFQGGVVSRVEGHGCNQFRFVRD